MKLKKFTSTCWTNKKGFWRLKVCVFEIMLKIVYVFVYAAATEEERVNYKKEIIEFLLRPQCCMQVVE